MLDRSIRFNDPWKKRGEDLLRDIQKHRKEIKLLSTNQWYRFRERVLRAESPGDIKKFLKTRKDRKKVRSIWAFRFRGQNFDEFLIQEFVRKIEDKPDIRRLEGIEYFNLKISDALPECGDEELRLAILRKILLRFIDRVLLIREGLNFEFKKGKTEVSC